ncbi:hypothetical protein JW935_11060 [candidate division KSB1 bacterium]|nr:hypothetical protein [candidate division KSB1 bacterium]
MQRLIFIIILIAGLACHKANVFEPSQTDSGKTYIVSNEDTVIAVKIYDPNSGIKNLFVEKDGRAVVNNFDSFLEKRTFLTDNEIEKIVRTFNDNNYQTFDDPPRRENLDIFPHYDIYFSDGQYKKTTSIIQAPTLESNNPFITEINRISELILNDGLSIELFTSDTVLSKQAGLCITLVVKNINSSPMDFLFESETTHDIFISTQYPDGNNFIIWNLAHNRSNNLVTNARTLAGGSSSSISVIWDGKDNDGQKVTGHFYLYAEVLSWPGGTTLPTLISVE